MAELEAALAANRPARLDAEGLTFVDEDGLRVLRQALGAGVALSPRRAFLSELLHPETA